MTYSSNNGLRNGTVEIIPQANATLTSRARLSQRSNLKHDIYRWSFPKDRPARFTVDFDVYTDGDGLRRFVPLGDVATYIDQAFWAGLSLLSTDPAYSKEYSSTYRAMKIIFDRVRHMQEHYDRDFDYSRDLFVRRGGRNEDAERSVLPANIGWTSIGGVRSWSSRTLIEEGRLRARELGLEVLTNDIAIAYGLLAAAELDPLVLSNDQVEPLVRSALFATPAGKETLSENAIESVYGRLIDRLNEHRGDDPVKFDKWFSGPKNNLFGSLAGKGIGNAVVRQAMLELGWRANEYVKGCLHKFALALASALPDPLDTSEHEQYSHMYVPQAYLGGLPLHLVMDRKQLLAPIMGRLWTTPGDRQVISVLHRLLEYYGMMAVNRREADVRSKSRSGRAEISNTDLRMDSLCSAQQCEALSPQEILRVAALRYGWLCPNCSNPLEAELDDEAGTQLEGAVTLSCYCEKDDYHCQVEVPRHELAALAAELGFSCEDVLS